LAEADYAGMILAAKAGYHPKDILQAWGQMEAQRLSLNGESDSSMYVDSRLKQLERRIEQATKHYEVKRPSSPSERSQKN
jgi:hypothetical protein